MAAASWEHYDLTELSFYFELGHYLVLIESLHSVGSVWKEHELRIVESVKELRNENLSIIKEERH